MYSLGVLRELNLFNSDTSDISEEIINHIKNHERVGKKEMKTKNDHAAIKFSFIFDINYKECLKEFLDNLISYYESLEHKDKFTILLDYNKEYMKERGI